MRTGSGMVGDQRGELRFEVVSKTKGKLLCTMGWGWSVASFARWVSGIVGDQGQNVMHTGVGVVGGQGAKVVRVVSGNVGIQGQHVMQTGLGVAGDQVATVVGAG